LSFPNRTTYGTIINIESKVINATNKKNDEKVGAGRAHIRHTYDSQV